MKLTNLFSISSKASVAPVFVSCCLLLSGWKSYMIKLKSLSYYIYQIKQINSADKIRQQFVNLINWTPRGVQRPCTKISLLQPDWWRQ